MQEAMKGDRCHCLPSSYERGFPQTCATVPHPIRQWYQHASSEGFALGDTVYAPKQVEGQALRYVLAEVTGIQATAGTVTVNFRGGEPGVDDEAVPFHAIVPYHGNTPPVHSSEGRNAHTRFSDGVTALDVNVEGVLHVPLNRGDKVDMKTEESGGGDPMRVAAYAYSVGVQPGWPQSIYEPVNGILRDTQENDNWRVLDFTRQPCESADAFSARVFGTTCFTVSKCLEVPHAAGGGVILCVFATYRTLHHFDVYMTLRGYQTRLVDGNTRLAVCEGKTAGGSSGPRRQGTIWLCILADDMESEDTVAALTGKSIPFAKLEQKTDERRRCSVEPVGVVQFAEEVRTEKNEGGPWAEPRHLERATDKLIASIGCRPRALIRCELSEPANGDELAVSSLNASGSVVVATAFVGRKSGSPTMRRRAGETLELCLPATSWQIDLLGMLLSSCTSVKPEAADLRGLALQSTEANAEECDYVLPPSVLQAVANGNVFSSALSLASAFSQDVALLRGLQRRIVSDARFLGEEAAPLFVALRAILEDVLPLTSYGATTKWKRVVVCLSAISGKEGACSDYRHAVQRFLYPWRLHFLTNDEWQRPSNAAIMESLSWLEVGGVMLLSMEETLCRLSSLREEADIVIDCGVYRAVPCPLRDGVIHIALYSEVEVKGNHAHPFDQWRPMKGAKKIPSGNNPPRGATSYRSLSRGTPILSKAVALLDRLKKRANNRPKERVVSPRQETVSGVDWANFRQFVSRILISTCRLQGEQ